MKKLKKTSLDLLLSKPMINKIERKHLGAIKGGDVPPIAQDKTCPPPPSLYKC